MVIALVDDGDAQAAGERAALQSMRHRQAAEARADDDDVMNGRRGRRRVARGERCGGTCVGRGERCGGTCVVRDVGRASFIGHRSLLRIA